MDIWQKPSDLFIKINYNDYLHYLETAVIYCVIKYEGSMKLDQKISRHIRKLYL
jgi:hypothetical protein